MYSCPTFWTATDAGEIGLSHNPDSEQTYLDSLIVTRAFENNCCVIFVNCGGKKEEGFIGRSGVTLPFKGVVGKAVSTAFRQAQFLFSVLTSRTMTQQKSCEEELFFVDVDLSILKASFPLSLESVSQD
jgi:predicted amidohydrolase